MEKIDDYQIGSDCPKVKGCDVFIKNSHCLAGLCKCRAGFGASLDRRTCGKSKKALTFCHPIKDPCFNEKLICEDSTKICQCAPGYRYDQNRGDCEWVHFCDENSFWDSSRQLCIKSSDYWFPATNNNPKLSFITFILLVFCFIKVMRSNTITNNDPSFNERRRRLHLNPNQMNRNSLDFLSTIINYENGQRYQMRNSNDRNENGEVYYDENSPPPAYSDVMADSINKPDIMRDDLKSVNIDNQIANNNTINLNEQNLNHQNLNQQNQSLNEVIISTERIENNNEETNRSDRNNVQQSSQLNSNQINSNQINSNQINSNQINSNQINSNQQNILTSNLAANRQLNNNNSSNRSNEQNDDLPVYEPPSYEVAMKMI